MDDFRDTVKPVPPDDLSDFQTSINEQLKITNSTLADDAGAKDILRMKLVPNWKHAHKFWSVQLALISSAVCGLWVAMPAFQYFLPPITFALCCIGVSLFACVLRLVKQSNVDDDDRPPTEE